MPLEYFLELLHQFEKQRAPATNPHLFLESYGGRLAVHFSFETDANIEKGLKNLGFKPKPNQTEPREAHFHWVLRKPGTSTFYTAPNGYRASIFRAHTGGLAGSVSKVYDQGKDPEALLGPLRKSLESEGYRLREFREPMFAGIRCFKLHKT